MKEMSPDSSPTDEALCTPLATENVRVQEKESSRSTCMSYWPGLVVEMH